MTWVININGEDHWKIADRYQWQGDGALKKQRPVTSTEDAPE